MIFGIQFICFAIAFIIGNTSGDWGTAAIICIGGFIGGLVIGNIYGEVSDKNFKEKMEEERKYNEEHAFEIAAEKFKKDSTYHYKVRTSSYRDKKIRYRYIDWPKSYQIEKDINFLDNKPYDENEINEIATYLLRGDKEFLHKFIEEYEHSWQIALTDDEKRKLIDIAYTGNEEKYKRYKKEIAKNKKKEEEQKEQEEDLSHYNENFYEEDDITLSLFDNNQEKEKSVFSYIKVFHITDKQNLESIKQYGIKSRNAVESESNFKDIANREVEDNHRKVIIKGHPIDSYARCFFNPLPPMYHNRKDDNDLCIIELRIPFTISEKNIDGKKYECFNLEIDGAKNNSVALSEGVTWNRWDVEKIIVHDLTKIFWKSGRILESDNKKDILAKRSAELLVYPEIPAKYIYEIYCDDDSHEPISKLDNISSSGRVSIHYD